jgi:pentatricopeptide repeat protein
MVIDALRRAQCWDEALEYYRNVDARNLDQAVKAVLNFQQHLCVVHDAECYDMSSAENFAKLPP